MSILLSAAGLLIALTLLLQYKKRVSRKLLFSMLSCVVAIYREKLQQSGAADHDIGIL